MDDPVGQTIYGLGREIEALWELRMKNETADQVLAERPRIRALALQLHTLANDLIQAEAAE